MLKSKPIVRFVVSLLLMNEYIKIECSKNNKKESDDIKCHTSLARFLRRWYLCHPPKNSRMYHRVLSFLVLLLLTVVLMFFSQP